VHVQGPDTLVAQPDRETAERRAAEQNAVIEKIMEAREPSPYDPMLHCVARPWPYTAKGHAEDLAKHGGNPEDWC
jgi:hypothetical protein